MLQLNSLILIKVWLIDISSKGFFGRGGKLGRLAPPLSFLYINRLTRRRIGTISRQNLFTF